MFYTVYKITNKVNGKIYIGKHQTAHLDDDYFGSGKRLKYAVNKYGRENFTKEILHVFDTEDEMNAKEAELVSEGFCKRDDTYNICEGGKGGWSFVNREILDFSIRSKGGKIGGVNAIKSSYRYRKNTAEQLTKISNSLKKYYEKNPNPMLGKTHSDEWKRNHSKFMKTQVGEKHPAFGSRWITNGLENRKIKVDIVPEGWYYGRVIKI